MQYAYADRKNDRQTVESFHADAEAVLGDTYGLMIYQESTPPISEVIFSCKTPVSATETTTFWVQARNYKLEPEHDAERGEGILAVYRQEAAIGEYLTPEVVPPGSAGGTFRRLRTTHGQGGASC